MKPEKAIEILSLAAPGHAFTTGTEFYDALNLGIEALKRVKAERTGYETYAPDLLPGETEE